jgi:beta-glucanase (GH16 family)
MLVSFISLNKLKHKPKWKLTWKDEFNYEGLPDSTKWNYDTGGEGWGNDELQYYTKQRKQNVEVLKGNLSIKAIREKFEANNYTSTRLVTKGKKDFRYGKFEIRAKIPTGRGLWPACWMLSSKEPRIWPDDGEIDILENVGYTPGEITGAAHVRRNKTSNAIITSSNSTTIFDDSDAFHIYRLIWTPERLEWYVDDKLFHFYDKADRPPLHWPFNGKFYLIFNLAVGGSWGGKNGIDDSIFPQTFIIDYVRVYEDQNLSS